ncbi:MAG: TonB-dependent receptor plug domain-containing protein [Flavobacteriaceae bacterium]|nr:TonB-dependent receptor plug domain-containing protein [Flavobacteriaceae bacterium]
MTKGIDKLIDGSYEINFHNFDILPGLIETDVLQTIQTLPGISSSNETVSNINIRGGTHDQNLILWDGIKMYQSGHFFGLISMFNPHTTKDISLIKNATDVDLTDGVSGTISMKTDSKINPKTNGGFGSNFINMDGLIDIPLGNKSSVQISARKALNNLLGAPTPTYDNYFDRILQNTEVKDADNTKSVNSNINFDFYDVGLRWLYRISEKDHIKLNFLNVANELIFNETAELNNIRVSKESSLIQNSIAGGIQYERNWNSFFTTVLSIYETDYNLEATNVDISNDQRLLQINEVSETSIRLNAWYKYNDDISFLNGYQFIETGITNRTDVDNPRFLRSIIEVTREHALYSQINYVTNKLALKLGGRYSYISDFDKHFIEPRLSINYKINNSLNVELLGEFKHQNSSQIIDPENDFLGVEKRRWQLANDEDIPVIKSKQISVGGNFSKQGWLLNAEIYFKNVDGIYSRSQAFLNQYEFATSSGSYQTHGVDLLVNKRFKKISSWVSYSYAINDYTFEDFAEVNFPNNIDTRHSFTAGISFSSQNLNISAGVNYRTAKPNTRPQQENEIENDQIRYEDANSSRIKDYLRIDASAMYNFNLSQKIKAKLGVSLWNISNQENILSSYFTIDDTNQVQEVETKALDLTPNMSLTLSFK